MFISKLQASSADDRSAYGNFWFTPVGIRTASGVRVTPELAMALPIVLACVRVRSESFAILPPRIYQRSGNTKKLLAKHWLYDLFRRPNPFQTGFEWRQMLQSHVDLRGNAYNEIQTNRSGDITALMPLHPDRMRIVPIGTGDFDYRYEYTQRDGAKVPYSRSDIWHLRGMSSDGITGMTPITVARESVGLGLAAQSYGSRFFQNDAKPGGWIGLPAGSTFKDKAARDQFRESFQEAQAGLNKHKTAVLEGGMTYNEIGLTNKDSQFLEARQFQVTDIARMYRTPPHKVGDLSKSAFANIEQQSLEFVIDCMLPLSVNWESSTETNLLLQEESDISIEFDFTALLRGDQAARSVFYHNGIMDGWMVRNEARAREGEEPLPGLDKPLVPLNMVALDKDGNPETPPPGASPSPVKPPQTGSDARMSLMIRSNAERMARRIAAGSFPPGAVFAEAFAVPLDQAQAWLAHASRVASTNESEIHAALVAFAMKGSI